MIGFSKYSGCGNDFIMIDDRTSVFPLENEALIQKMCHRQKGIGADGVILLQKSDLADFKMRIFNADGKEAEMCGNGLRCLGKYLQELKVPSQNHTVEMMNQTLNVAFAGDLVQTSMPTPSFLVKELTLNVDGENFTAAHLDTGVPHLVLFVDNVEAVDVQGLGKKLRHHPAFSPRGTNVNFVEKTGGNTLKIRTYERGVENETLACGTGCLAAAAAAVEKWNLPPQVQLKTRSSETLTIDLITKTQTGPAVKTFQGTINVS